jgi:hypothetical protein
VIISSLPLFLSVHTFFTLTAVGIIAVSACRAPHALHVFLPTALGIADDAAFMYYTVVGGCQEGGSLALGVELHKVFQ